MAVHLLIHLGLARCRTKLEREGWYVPPSVSTVPIPGVNMPKNADYRTYVPPT